MNSRPIILALAAVAGLSTAQATPIRVTLRGHVETNGIHNINSTLYGVPVGAPIVWKFTVDSTNFTDSFVSPSPNNPNVRSFPIPNDATFDMKVGGVPVPLGTGATVHPYFTLVNGWPGADSFHVSNVTNPGAPTGVPVSIGMTGATTGFYVSYNGSGTPSLGSLDITQAVGTWTYTNLSVYRWSIGAPGGANGQILEVYDSLTISCPADLDDGSGTGTPDGGVDINDLLYFLAMYEAGDIAADVDDGGGNGVPDAGVDINDLLFFLAHYEAGC